MKKVLSLIGVVVMLSCWGMRDAGAWGIDWSSEWSEFSDNFNDATKNSDDDNHIDALDNCDDVGNPDQLDTDDDAEGDACDADDDGDGVADAEDTCPLIVNDDQTDADADGIGDACDVCPEDADATHQDAAACGDADAEVDPEDDLDHDGIADDQDSCIDQSGTAGNNGCPAELDLSPPAEISGYDEGGSCSLIPDASKGWLGFVLIGLGLIPLLRRRGR